MKVLIIDDEQAILKMYATPFEARGNEVITAVDGATGLQFAKNQQPDIILLDIIMPRVNGLDILKDLKADNNTKNIPVVLLTNLPEECSEEKAKELGAAGYLVKAQNEPSVVLEKVLAITKK
jgi:CheY-like chemotaxis protein